MFYFDMIIHPAMFQQNDDSFWIKFRIQLCVIFLNLCCLFLKYSLLGSILGPRFDFWPCILFYLSIFYPQTITIFQLTCVGFFHDALFNSPLGFHGVLWSLALICLSYQRRYLLRLSNYKLWGYYIFFGFVIHFFDQLWHYVWDPSIFDPLLALMEYLLSIALYPYLLQICHRWFVRLGQNV